MHASQLDCPSADWYVPAAHALHVSLPPTAYVPAEQRACADDPFAHAEPAGHAAQSDWEAAPVVARYVPASHAVAAEAPAPHQLPAGHASQLDCPPAAWYVPAAHAVHSLAPAADTLPGEQASGSLDRARQ